jgi:UDP-3-O-[3-hydroxymyristoyl] glucosamine N-acyltransferase
MIKPVILYGSRTLAKMIYYDASDLPDFTIACFAVDATYLSVDRQFLGLPQVAYETLHETYPPELYDLLALHAGSDSLRERAEFYHRAAATGYKLRNYISPRCDLAPDVRIGTNNILMAQSHIGIDSTIGSNNLIRQQAYLGHGLVMGDHNVCAPGSRIGGIVTVGHGCYIGMGSVVLNRLSVADETLVGAGCVMIRPSEPYSRNVGNPGRIIGYHQAEGIRLRPT